ncbi:MAG TPA: [Fe-Fe] hydrogenase large subunit C-terminal domain-containing protein, partial [Chitinispirillaceae bacterium]|nr:[Fe-Fe] hydrogenase large subunit C-terminal domain-containing protein [Chitinispirillaceae bacterium]
SDCYRCIRECPVKAIRVINGEAEVMADKCILCGHCVAVCPVGAKRVRDDLRRALYLLNRKKKVILSLAPSFAGEFDDVPVEKLINGIRKLGFFGVSETAIGAQEVSEFIGKMISKKDDDLMLSTACPAAVDLVLKYFPQYSDKLTGVYSPLLAHCVLLRKIYGDDIGIVFAGPCIAKKKEADKNPDLLDVVITFEDLRKWLESSKIDFEKLDTSSDDHFIPFKAQNGALYPIEGGMIATLDKPQNRSMRFMTLSGVETIYEAFSSLDFTSKGRGLFIELLACENGCIRGPKVTKTTPVGSRMSVIDYADDDNCTQDYQVTDKIECKYFENRVNIGTPELDLITLALESIGKTKPEDELNCDSCGYGTCRGLAAALVENKAEPCMCSSYMRQMAQKKANALIKTIPYGVVIVDNDLRIIDSNDHFANLLGQDIEEISNVIPGLTNADLSKIVPFHGLFSKVLMTGEDITQQFVKYHDQIIAITVFTVEKSRIAGAILRDATTTESKREQIVEKAQEVIRNTSVTAQKIAFLMGKNAAQSEKILNSLIESFSTTEDTDNVQGATDTAKGHGSLL